MEGNRYEEISIIINSYVMFYVMFSKILYLYCKVKMYYHLDFTCFMTKFIKYHYRITFLYMLK